MPSKTLTPRCPDLASLPVKLAYKLTEVCVALQVTPRTIHYWSEVLGLHPICRCKNTPCHPQRYYRRAQVEKLAHARYLSQTQHLPPRAIREQLCSR